MEANGEKTALVEQGAQKKAARRAAFIQEIAEAVALIVYGPTTKRGPFAQACYKQGMADWLVNQAQQEEADGLRWAIKQGLLPVGAIALPSEELQLHLLAKSTHTIQDLQEAWSPAVYPLPA
jgi:hypothetical protein